MREPTLAELAAKIDRLTEIEERLARAQEQLVDYKAAAQHMGVGVRTLKRWVANGEVPFRRLGRTVRFRLSLLNR